jgi:hypothetical protein
MICVFQEEIFGPAVALTTFSSTEEAIAIANDTPYGLGAGVCLVMLTNYSKFHVLFVEFGKPIQYVSSSCPLRVKNQGSVVKTIKWH